MPPRAPALLAALPLALAACAGAQGVREPSHRPRAAARAAFPPAVGDAVFEQAVYAAALAGYRIRACDPDRWRFETEPVEFDARCGATTCLVRQSLEVKLGYRVARVTVEREHFDGSWRAWEDQDLGSSLEAARDLLDRMLVGFGPEDTRTRLVPVRDRTDDPAPLDPCAAPERARRALVASAAFAP